MRAETESGAIPLTMRNCADDVRGTAFGRKPNVGVLQASSGARWFVTAASSGERPEIVPAQAGRRGRVERYAFANPPAPVASRNGLSKRRGSEHDEHESLSRDDWVMPIRVCAAVSHG